MDALATIDWEEHVERQSLHGLQDDENAVLKGQAVAAFWRG
jgi:hypothetical protein